MDFVDEFPPDAFQDLRRRDSGGRGDRGGWDVEDHTSHRVLQRIEKREQIIGRYDRTECPSCIFDRMIERTPNASRDVTCGCLEVPG
jgi:hypothetical protein